MARISKLGNYDNSFGMSSPIVGSQSTGKVVIKNPIVKKSEHDDEEIDDFVDDIVDAPQGKVNKKIVNGMAMSASDPYAPNSADRAAGQLRNTGGSNIFEYSNHTTTIMKGFSPNITYRSKSNNKGLPNFNAQSNASKEYLSVASYIKDRPGRKSGTEKGTSRPHKLLTDIEDDPIFNLKDIDDPLVKAFKKQQNEIKSIISYVKEYL